MDNKIVYIPDDKQNKSDVDLSYWLNSLNIASLEPKIHNSIKELKVFEPTNNKPWIPE